VPACLPVVLWLLNCPQGRSGKLRRQGCGAARSSGWHGLTAAGAGAICLDWRSHFKTQPPPQQHRTDRTRTRTHTRHRQGRQATAPHRPHSHPHGRQARQADRQHPHHRHHHTPPQRGLYALSRRGAVRVW
jgi:hypothetical protein